MTSSKIKAYIYPLTSRAGGMVNPYIYHFVSALENKFEFVNRNKPAHTGLFDILKYWNQFSILFLNWSEEAPERKGGILQSFFFIVLVYYLKYRRVKIFWTFHNKVSHGEKRPMLKEYLRRFTARHSDFIITHAKEGIPIVKELSKPGNPRIRFFHHPVLPPVQLQYGKNKLYDILIWGMVTPYKGIDRFLSFVRQEQLEHLKILVAGKIQDKTYRNIILSYQNDHIKIINAFISDKELEKYIVQSRAVLFTYLESSILSSGALMDTLRYSPFIIGPDFGAFKDLQDEGLILTFKDYTHLKIILQDCLDLKPDSERIRKFIIAHSWKKFGISIFNFIFKE